MSYVIEKGIPMPTPTQRGKDSPLAQALRQMAVGESIFCEGAKHKTTAAAIQRTQRKQKTRFTSRSIDGASVFGGLNRPVQILFSPAHAGQKNQGHSESALCFSTKEQR